MTLIISYIISNLYMFNPCVRDRDSTTIIITLYGLRIDLESIYIFLPEFLYELVIGYFNCTIH